MSRFNTIFAGPVSKTLPQTKEAITVAAIMPGTAVVRAAGKFVQASAGAKAPIFIAHENFLALKGIDTPWPVNAPMIALRMPDSHRFHVRTPTGATIQTGAGLTTDAAGRFVPVTTGQTPLVWADETYSNTSGADQLVRVRAI